MKTRDELIQLYPEQTPDFLDERIKGADTPLKVWRAFVPYYYLLLHDQPQEFAAFTDLQSFVGWCAGDPHHENFGTLLDAAAKPIFTVSDFDDSGPCATVADWLRFLTAVSLYEDQRGGFRVDTKDLLQAYRAGLTGGEWKWTKYVQDLVEESVQDGMRFKKKDLTKDGDSLSRDDDSLVQLSPNERKVVERALGSKYKVLDALSKQRLVGGSAGLKRYVVLVRAGDTQSIVELKQLATPGVAVLASAKMPTQSERLRKSWDTVFAGQAPAIYMVVEIDGVAYQVRPLWKGIKGIDSSAYKGPEFSRIVQDEAYALGVFHARGLGTEAAAYLRAFEGVSEDRWNKTIDALGTRIKDAFKNL